MPTLFKIFLFLFLQQGIKTTNPPGDGSINWETVLLPCNTTLSIQADPMVLEQIFSLCFLQDGNCEIRKEAMSAEARGMEKASIAFKNLSYGSKNKMMERLKPMQGIAVLQWNNSY